MVSLAHPVQMVYNAHSLRAIVKGDCRDQQGNHFLGDLVMDVYTGWKDLGLFTDYFDEEVGRAEIVSYVPLGPIEHGPQDPGPQFVDIQAYNNLGIDGRPLTQAVVHATIAAVGDNPAVAALDFATIHIEPRLFPGAVGEQFVLILRLNLGIQDERIHAISYHITVLSQPKEQGGGGLAELFGARVPIDRGSQPF